MCGLFGFISRDNETFNPKLLEQIARDTESRGPHAFGFAWVDSRNRLRMFKQRGRISDYLSLLHLARDARMLVGHCRYATHGSPSNNLNNHPHPCDGGWLVHNGVIGQCEEISEQWNLQRVTECDSEALALLIEELDGTLVERCTMAIEECATSALAMLGLWRNPLRLVAGRSGNPLYLSKQSEGYYLASNASAMSGAMRVKDESLLVFDQSNGVTRMRQYDLADVMAQV